MRLVFESIPVLIDGVVAYLLTKTMCQCYAFQTSVKYLSL